MSTRRQRSEQKGKDGKRPRAFHRGRAQGVKNDRLLRETLEPAYAAAAADRILADESSKAHQREQADWDDLIGSLDHVAPFVLAGFPTDLG